MTDQAIVRGVVAELRWAYYTAAGIEGWTVIRDPKGARPKGAPAGWSLSARVVQSDPFKLAQRPLVFVAPHAKGRWVWPVERFVVVNGALSARLGPVEEY